MRRRVAARRRLTLRVVPLPPGSDPADLVRAEGAGAVRERVEASVAFVRFRVERELERADLASAEGKDAAIAALAPVMSDLADEALRQDLLRVVSDRTDLTPAIVEKLLPRHASPAAAGRAGSDDAVSAVHAALDASGLQERSFLAHVVALPQAGREALAALDIERVFTNRVTRRAAAHLLEHVDAPAEGIPVADEELSVLIAALSVADVRRSDAALQAELLSLELLCLEREITAAQRAATGDVALLKARQQELRARRNALIGTTIEETAAAQ